MLFAFFCVNPRRLNFIFRRFGTFCLFHLHRQVGRYAPMRMEQSVPKSRHIKFWCRGITQKKAYNVQNTAKVGHQEYFRSVSSHLMYYIYGTNILFTADVRSSGCNNTYLLTYSMVQSPSWEANWFAASQEIPLISRNPKVHHRTHKRPPPVSILGQLNPVHIPTSHLLEIHLNIIHPSTPSRL